MKNLYGCNLIRNGSDAMVRAVSEMEEIAETASGGEMKKFAFVAAATESAPVVKRLRSLTSLKP